MEYIVFTIRQLDRKVDLKKRNDLTQLLHLYLTYVEM